MKAHRSKVTVTYWDYKWTGKLNKAKRPKRLKIICNDLVRVSIGSDKKAIAILFPTAKGIVHRRTIEQIKKITIERW